MTSRYRVEYALKTHRRDQLIEWIKGLLAVPFVLHSQPTAAYDSRSDVLTKMATTTHKRYAEILRDVEELVNNHIAHQKDGTHERSKLKLLVPGVGVFFTPLLLEKAFVFQDERRRISSRRFVPPSFNDIRLILNSAQILSLVEGGPLQLVTFDGDVTLYDDGTSLTADNPVIPRIVHLLAQGIKVGIVTAAGYTEAAKYYGRLYGLLEHIKAAVLVETLIDPVLVVLGGESNYLFGFDPSSEYLLRYVPRPEWLLPEMRRWTEESITILLDVAEKALRECIFIMKLSADIVRKDRAVGIVASNKSDAQGFTREQLEETVLVTQQVVEMSPVAKILPFCAFNACTTAWIANPSETVQLLDELAIHSESKDFRRKTPTPEVLGAAP
ncbi:IMP and pyridine-specific 5'-nucleotidase, partial [Lecanoromycetidae sp. Uapishka_2]